MRRASATHLISAAIGAVFWAAAILLPQSQPALAQWVGIPHQLSQPAAEPANPAAAYVRDVIHERSDPARELECLALNVYWEARGESPKGQSAVAAVTLNRVAHSAFPDSICQVVRQGVRYGLNRCQFSWACDRYADRPRDGDAWADAKEVAFRVLYMDEPDPTQGALYFHATRVRPNWSRSMVKVARIGRHIYYREPMSAENDWERTRS